MANLAAGEEHSRAGGLSGACLSKRKVETRLVGEALRTCQSRLGEPDYSVPTRSSAEILSFLMRIASRYAYAYLRLPTPTITRRSLVLVREFRDLETR